MCWTYRSIGPGLIFEFLQVGFAYRAVQPPVDKHDLPVPRLFGMAQCNLSPTDQRKGEFREPASRREFCWGHNYLLLRDDSIFVQDRLSNKIMWIAYLSHIEKARLISS